MSEFVEVVEGEGGREGEKGKDGEEKKVSGEGKEGQRQTKDTRVAAFLFAYIRVYV